MSNPAETFPVRNHLICAVQSFTQEDCNSPLVSDGFNWTCPYGHAQGFDGLGHLIRKIPDRRCSVRQGTLNREIE